jgi:hypothetical protein
VFAIAGFSVFEENKFNSELTTLEDVLWVVGLVCFADPGLDFGTTEAGSVLFSGASILDIGFFEVELVLAADVLDVVWAGATGVEDGAGV